MIDCQLKNLHYKQPPVRFHSSVYTSAIGLHACCWVSHPCTTCPPLCFLHIIIPSHCTFVGPPPSCLYHFLNMITNRSSYCTITMNMTNSTWDIKNAPLVMSDHTQLWQLKLPPSGAGHRIHWLPIQTISVNSMSGTVVDAQLVRVWLHTFLLGSVWR